MTSALTAGDVTAWSECTTTSTVSPDSAGNAVSSRFWAALESEPGRGVVGLELAAEGGGQDAGQDQHRQPGEHGAATVAEGQPGEPAERADLRGRLGCGDASLLRRRWGADGHGACPRGPKDGRDGDSDEL